MTTTNYVTDQQFRNCLNNKLVDPSPFINGTKINDQYFIDPKNKITSSVLKVLAIDDTFHDFSKDRSGYNAAKFNAQGPANYLLTGNFFNGDNVGFYKNNLNNVEYKNATGTFENKVTSSFEISKGLQRADIAIPYDLIIDEFIITEGNKIEIKENLKNKIKLSNGSIQLCLDLDKPMFKGLDTSKINFSEYLFYITNRDENKINLAKLRISGFIRWYLHSNSFYQYTLPNESMKVLSDAGISFLGDIFEVNGSNVTPFIAIPCFLDSAGTSVSLLDPNLPLVFEYIENDLVIPIVSNYFCCDEYFMCYLLNENTTFDKDNLYNFSVVFLKIDSIPRLATNKDFKQCIEIVRNSDSILSTDYIDACKIIKEYIDAYPALTARYFFGEVKKDSKTDDNSSCGTCGAGVPYLGKILDVLIKQRNSMSTKAFNGLWTSPNIDKIKGTFNNLKNLGSLNSRIPIGDARILKMFCNVQNNGTYCSIQQNNLDSLFKILADYKRTGDYQQSYTVLKQILTDKTNIKCYTFCSGDELSTLVGRILGIPSIYKIANGANCYLYRCNLYQASEEERIKTKIVNDISIIGNYIVKIIYKLNLTYNFVNSNYLNICTLRDQLITIITKITENNSMSNIIIQFEYYNAIEILSEIIMISNSIVNKDDKNFINNLLVEIDNVLSEYINILNEYKTNNNFQYNDNFLQNIATCLVNIAKIENDNVFQLFLFIQENFPLIFNHFETNTIVDDFQPLTETDIQTMTFSRSMLGVTVKNGKDNSKDKSKKSLIIYINKKVEDEKNALVAKKYESRNTKAKEKEKEIKDNTFVNDYNTFINNFKSPMIAKYILESIQNFNENYISEIKTNLLNRLQFIKTELIHQCNNETYTDIETTLKTLIADFNKRNLPDISITNVSSTNKPSEENLNTQEGGVISDIQGYNRFCIYYEIQKLILNITNKCAIYISNVSKKEMENNVNPSIVDLLNNISKDYETDDFCSQLLFEQNDDTNLDNENNGLLISLKQIANQYTLSDLVKNNKKNTQENEPISVNEMLDILNLKDIKLFILLLAWGKEENIELVYDLMNKYNENDNEEENINQKLEINLGFYAPIYNYLLTNNNTSLLSIYSILALSFVNYTYYGSKSICFNNDYCQEYSKILLNSYNPNGYIYLNNSSEVFLKSDLKVISNSIYDNIANKIGVPNTARGVVSNLRSTTTRKKRQKQQINNKKTKKQKL